MSDGSHKKVQDIKKGDRVVTASFLHGKGIEYTIGEIECIVRTECDDLEKMIQIDNLHITPYHPILVDYKWGFPINTGEEIYMEIPYIYTFVINNRRSVIIDDYIFATLGHNMTGEVIGHQYFGTNDVISDLKKKESYHGGVVDLKKDMLQRDTTTNNVIGIY
tara:strand:+ start:86 stop:574 length:489 start_codon:yes stop_codon:yes gene_type:complete